MKRFLKIASISLLLILGILFALPFIFKGKIIEKVKQEANNNLNAKVNFSNDIGISLFKQWPKMTVSLKDLSIVGIDTFKHDTLAYLPELDVSFNLMSIIKGDKMEISHIRLNKPNLNW